jgi:hypothetical protein
MTMQSRSERRPERSDLLGTLERALPSTVYRDGRLAAAFSRERDAQRYAAQIAGDDLCETAVWHAGQVVGCYYGDKPVQGFETMPGVIRYRNPDQRSDR